ncbi:uncharacterized protein V1516DRAFT_678415 [Lipomyces oligophaga]|uniref:uncharacterized protein n=1 Tax=Lipomyces oligophaga TaxID=45792 RepID=UPI0034CE7D0D
MLLVTNNDTNRRTFRDPCMENVLPSLDTSCSSPDGTNSNDPTPTSKRKFVSNWIKTLSVHNPGDSNPTALMTPPSTSSSSSERLSKSDETATSFSSLRRISSGCKRLVGSVRLSTGFRFHEYPGTASEPESPPVSIPSPVSIPRISPRDSFQRYLDSPKLGHRYPRPRYIELQERKRHEEAFELARRKQNLNYSLKVLKIPYWIARLPPIPESLQKLMETSPQEIGCREYLDVYIRLMSRLLEVGGEKLEELQARKRTLLKGKKPDDELLCDISDQEALLKFPLLRPLYPNSADDTLAYDLLPLQICANLVKSDRSRFAYSSYLGFTLPPKLTFVGNCTSFGSFMVCYCRRAIMLANGIRRLEEAQSNKGLWKINRDFVLKVIEDKSSKALLRSLSVMESATWNNYSRPMTISRVLTWITRLQLAARSGKLNPILATTSIRMSDRSSLRRRKRRSSGVSAKFCDDRGYIWRRRAENMLFPDLGLATILESELEDEYDFATMVSTNQASALSQEKSLSDSSWEMDFDGLDQTEDTSRFGEFVESVFQADRLSTNFELDLQRLFIN